MHTWEHVWRRQAGFVLQVRWAKWSLERARVKAGRGAAGRPLEHGDVLAHQLSHFVNTLHQFVMDRLLHGAWLELQQVGGTLPLPSSHAFTRLI